MKIETNIHSIENAFWNGFSSLFLLLVLGLRIQRMNSLILTRDLSSGNNQKLNSSTCVGDSNLNITLVGSEIIYDIFLEYDFFVPEVDVICQCGCTNERRESCRPLDRNCALLVNSTTTCTNYITVDTDPSMCSKYYKLCCQVYFTKSKMMKPFKALHLKYRETILTFNVSSQSNETKPTICNVADRMENFLVGHHKVLHIREFIPVRVIPNKWYVIEDGTNKLFHSGQMNAKHELNMNKIGWFRYDDKTKELSRVTTWDLEKHLHVKVLDCHSNPPQYEWKLDAIHYVSKGSLRLPEKMEEVSEFYKNISKYSICLNEKNIKLEPVNPFNVKCNLSNVSSTPFIFTANINKTTLNLTFTKGNGTFDVEITSSHWTDIYSFRSSSLTNIINLPSKNYDQCWVCVSQNIKKLCQISSLVNENSKTAHTAKNETDCQKSVCSADTSKDVGMIITITILTFLLVTSLPVLLILLIHYRRKLKVYQKKSGRILDDKIL